MIVTIVFKFHSSIGIQVNKTQRYAKECVAGNINLHYHTISKHQFKQIDNNMDTCLDIVLFPKVDVT